MKMKLLLVSLLMLLRTNSLTSAFTPTTDEPRTTTTGPTVANLKGKMFTLTQGISLFPPNFTPSSTSWPPSYRTQRSTARPYTAPPTTQTTGISVCLRYTYTGRYTSTLFTLSPSKSPLALRLSYFPEFILSHNVFGRTNIGLRSDIKLWSKIQPEVWTRVCVTVDSEKGVAQVFSGCNMSIRKFLTTQYVWSGEPVIDIADSVDQVTDVQVWDYPLRYKEVFNYMTNGVYGSYSGNVLTWSSIGFSLRGKTLLEDVYEELAKQPIRGERERRRKGGREARKRDEEKKEVAEKREMF